jgi:hypothetical protein
MKMLSDFVISVFELAEAEGRDLRTTVRTEAAALRAEILCLSLAIGVLAFAVLLFTGAAGLIVFGLLLWLESQVSRPLAAVLAGLGAFVLGIGCVVLFRLLTRKAKS